MTASPAWKRLTACCIATCVMAALPGCNIYLGDTPVRLADLRHPQLYVHAYNSEEHYWGSTLGLWFTWDGARYPTPGCISVADLKITVNGQRVGAALGGQGGYPNYHGGYPCLGLVRASLVDAPTRGAAFSVVLEDPSARWEVQLPEWKAPDAQFELLDSPQEVYPGARIHVHQVPGVGATYVPLYALLDSNSYPVAVDGGFTCTNRNVATDLELSPDSGDVSVTLPTGICLGEGRLLLTLGQDAGEGTCASGLDCVFSTYRRSIEVELPLVLVPPP